MADTDSEKLEAALTQLEEERERRLQARIDSGEIVSVQTHVVVHRGESVEAATARAIDAHPIPDGHHRKLFFIFTGVPGPVLGYGKPQAKTISSEGNSSTPSSEETARSDGALSFPPSSEPAYVRVVISNGGEDDPGAIVEAWWTIEDGLLVLRDADDKHLTSRALLKDDDPALLAKSLLREAEKPKAFNDPIHYPKLGLA